MKVDVDEADDIAAAVGIRGKSSALALARMIPETLLTLCSIHSFPIAFSHAYVPFLQGRSQDRRDDGSRSEQACSIGRQAQVDAGEIHEKYGRLRCFNALFLNYLSVCLFLCNASYTRATRFPCPLFVGARCYFLLGCVHLACAEKRPCKTPYGTNDKEDDSGHKTFP